MQTYVSPAPTDKIWVKVLFGVVDYVLYESEDNKSMSWFKKQIDLAGLKPLSSTFVKLISKRGSLCVKTERKEKQKKNIEFTSTDAKNSYALVNKVFKCFLSFTLPDIKEESLSLYCSTADRKNFVRIDFIDSPTSIENFGLPNTKRKRPKTIGEEYIAFYAGNGHSYKIGFVTINWEIKDDTIIRLFEATLLLHESTNSSEIEFRSIGAVGQFSKSKLLSVYFVNFQCRKQGLTNIYFQAVIDIDVNSREVIFGTYSSIKGIKNAIPSCGKILMTKSNKNEYEQLKNIREDQSLLYNKSDEDHIKKLQTISYLLKSTHTTTHVTPTSTLSVLNNNDWLTLANQVSGRYDGIFNYKKINKDSLVKQHFLLDIYPTGQCNIYFSDHTEHKGSCSVKSNQVFIDISGSDLHNLHFAFLIDSPTESINTGIFYGKAPFVDSVDFSSGLVGLIKTQDLTEPITNLPQSEASKIEVHNHQYGYRDLINSTSSGFTDNLIIKKLINNASPVEINYSDQLRSMKLHRHYKYLTFRAPKSERPGTGLDDSFRIEKCDVVFTADFDKVTIKSKSRLYEGRTYYNNKVLFMILNPVNDETLIDSYLAIQVVLPFNEDVSNLDLLFGTSMWKGSDNLEAKMITLVKAIDGDDETDTYRLGTHGSPDPKGINDMIIEDKKYNGALSYLIGRLNRFIRASSSQHTYEMYRPRDKSNREAYLYAAIYAASMANVSKASNVKSSTEDSANYILKAKKYLFEAYMHQYGANVHAGEEINKINSNHPDIQIRLKEMQSEQLFLRKAIKDINNSEIKDFAASLWPYLKRRK